MKNTDLDKYFKKIYTIAYRLTGDEEAACDLSEISIENISEKIILDKLTKDNLYKETFTEMFKIYTSKEVFLQNNNKVLIQENKVQDALSNLDPRSRATLIWRDILGYTLNEMPCNYKENLNEKLAVARLILKNKLYKKY